MDHRSPAAPRPEFDYPYAFESLLVVMLDEVARRDRDSFYCDGEDGRFHVYADISPTTAPGKLVMRAGLDDVEVTCTFEVSTGEDGHATFAIPADSACAPAGLVRSPSPTARTARSPPARSPRAGA